MVSIADMAWNPDAHDEATNEALGHWYRDKGSLPGTGNQSEFDYMRQEYSRQKAAGGSSAPMPASTDIRQSEPKREPQTMFASPESLQKLGTLPGLQPVAQTQNDGPEAAALQAINAHAQEQARQTAEAGQGNPSIYLANEDQREIDRQRREDVESLDQLSAANRLNYLKQYRDEERMHGDVDAPAGQKDVKRAGSTPADDLFLSVMKPEQLEQLADINDQVLGTLTDQQKLQMKSGEGSILSIFDELNPEQQEKINQLSQSLTNILSPQQKVDLLFLNSGMLRDIDLQKRQAILHQLKKNDGTITYDDLVTMGVYQPGTLAESGIKRWLQNLGGGPANYHKLLEEEYRLNNLDTSFSKLDQEERQRRSAEQTMLLAMIAAPLVDRALYGSSNVAFGNNVYDNIERYGAQGNFKGGGLEGKGAELSPEYADSTLHFSGPAKKAAESAGDGLKMSDKQFGKKVGKHAQDFGLDPSSPENRDIVKTRANEIFNNPTEIREGVFRGQGIVLPNGANATGKVKFYIQGNDVVMTDMTYNFITIMKDGVNNLYVNKATTIWP